MCIYGRLNMIFYEQEANGKFKEIEWYGLDPSCGRYGIQIPKGVWHTVDVVFPSVILEVKDGKYEPISDVDILQM